LEARDALAEGDKEPRRPDVTVVARELAGFGRVELALRVAVG
jgi:hypothetical protein